MKNKNKCLSSVSKVSGIRYSGLFLPSAKYLDYIQDFILAMRPYAFTTKVNVTLKR